MFACQEESSSVSAWQFMQLDLCVVLLPADCHPALPNSFQVERIHGLATGLGLIWAEMLYISVRDLAFISQPLHLIQHQSGPGVHSFMNMSYIHNLSKTICRLASLRIEVVWVVGLIVDGVTGIVVIEGPLMNGPGEAVEGRGG